MTKAALPYAGRDVRDAFLRPSLKVGGALALQHLYPVSVEHLDHSIGLHRIKGAHDLVLGEVHLNHEPRPYL